MEYNRYTDILFIIAARTPDVPKTLVRPGLSREHWREIMGID